MHTKELERYLSRQNLKRRLIMAMIAATLLTLGFICNHLREASRTMVPYEQFPEIQHAVYNNSYIPWIIAGTTAGICACFVLLLDIILCKFKTVQIGEQYLTLYRGLLFCIIYVDCVEKGRTIPFANANIVDVWLANRVRATVCFRRTLLQIAHISFSNHTASIEV